MDVIEVIKAMLRGSGKSARQLSRDLGRSPNYRGSTIANNADVGTSNLAKMAEAMGYTVTVSGHDDVFVIDPRGCSDADDNQGAAD